MGAVGGKASPRKGGSEDRTVEMILRHTINLCKGGCENRTAEMILRHTSNIQSNDIPSGLPGISYFVNHNRENAKGGRGANSPVLYELVQLRSQGVLAGVFRTQFRDFRSEFLRGTLSE